MARERKSASTRRGRRRTLGLISAALAAPWILSSETRAQAAWPSKPVR